MESVGSVCICDLLSTNPEFKKIELTPEIIIATFDLATE